MMERKLQQAADALPRHNDDFLAVEEAFRKRQSRHRPNPKRRLILVLCLSLLLVGCVAGPTFPEYHLYNGSVELLFPGIGFDVLCEELGWDPNLGSAKKAAEEHGWTLPDTLGGSPQFDSCIFNLTTEESHWFTAMLFHHYTYHAVNYGYEMVTEVIKEDGSPVSANWTDAGVELVFASTENPVWRRQFGFNEQDEWVGVPSRYELETVQTVDYMDLTLYAVTLDFQNNFYGLISSYGQYVYWVDHDHNTAFYLYSRDDTTDFILSCAKELIDQMH